MRRLGIIVALFLTLIVFLFIINYRYQDRIPPTEQFIVKWFKNENETLATYIQANEGLDEDLVQGREALSETIGLWLRYALEKEDKLLFDKSLKTLEQFFLEDTGFIHWKISEEGDSEVFTNALVDDLRIIEALYDASQKWGEADYRKLATQISNYVTEFSKKGNVLTDFYEKKYKYSSDIITLSYVDTGALQKMLDYREIQKETYEQTLSILKNAPLMNGFFPKKYKVSQTDYQFEQEINMVDQALVAYHLSINDKETHEFLSFINEELKQNGVIYGKYDIQTKHPVVSYESPAVYGLLILYCLELDEISLANQLYNRMILFRNEDRENPYYGGYSVINGDTHIFDNILPLLAETRLKKTSR